MRGEGRRTALARDSARANAIPAADDALPARQAPSARGGRRDAPASGRPTSMIDGRARIAVVGAGAWGTALACHLASRAHAKPQVVLIARSADRAAEIVRDRRNDRYLRGVPLPDGLAVDCLPAAAAAASVLGALASGCTLARLDAQAQAYYESTVFVGRVDCARPCTAPRCASTGTASRRARSPM